MKQFFAALTLGFVLLPGSALAQPPIAFGARVTSANGADAAAFSAGDPISISYSLNTNVGDTNPDPTAGSFPAASQSLSVTFPTRNVFAVGTSGNVQTFNNADSGGGTTSDQVFVFSGAISSSSPLGGGPITSVEVDFLSPFVPSPGEPTMLSSDALPLFVPPYNDAFVILDTSHGTTFVHFEVAAPTVNVTANGSHGPLTLAPGGALTIDVQFDAPGTGLADSNVGIGFTGPFGVLWLTPSGGLSPTPVVLHSGPLPDFGPSQLYHTASTAGFPSGSYVWFMVVHDPASGGLNVGSVQVIVP
jgi:hypothetical protein